MGKKKKTNLEDDLLDPEAGTSEIIDEESGAGAGSTAGSDAKVKQQQHHHKSKGKKKKKRNLNDGITRVAIISDNRNSRQEDVDSGAINFSDMNPEGGYSNIADDEELSLTGGKMSHAQLMRRKVRNIIITIILVLAVVGIVLAGVLLSLPATYSCAVKNGNYYVVKVEAPEVSQADPPLVCAGAEVLISINGSHFLTNDGALPRVTLSYDPTHGASGGAVEEAAELLSQSGCEKVEVRRRNVAECDVLTFRRSFPADASTSPDATYDVYATVAQPRAPKAKLGNKHVALECAGNATKVLTVIPAPAATEVYPPFACVGEETAFKVTGHFFLDGAPAGQPTVDLCGEAITGGLGLAQCTPVAGVPGYEGVAACSELSFASKAAGCGGEAQSTPVPITNPEPTACSTPPAGTVTIAVARRPTVRAATPAVVCVAQGAVPITLAGTDFVTLNGVRPKVRVGGEEYAAATSEAECVDVASAGHAVRLCGEIGVDVPTTAASAGAVDAESVGIAVASPLGTCANAAAYNITVLPAPTFEAMVNETVCAQASGLRVRARGNFVAERGAAFAVAVGQGGAFSAEGTALRECTSTLLNGRYFDRCAELEFPVPEGIALGEHPVTIQGLCAAHMDAAFATIPTPAVTAVSIEKICTAEATDLTVTGSDFLVFHGRSPDVVFTAKGGSGAAEYTVDGSAVTAGGCTDVSDTYSLCTQLTFAVPAGALAAGAADMAVRNGPANGRNCVGRAHAVTFVPKPSITGVTGDICENQDAEVVVTGANFVAGVSEPVFFDTASGAEYPAAEITTATNYTVIRIAVPANFLPAGKYVVRVENSPVGGCQATASSSTQLLVVHANTLAILAAEPPVVVAGTPAATPLTLYARNFAAVPDYIELRSADGAKTLRFDADSIEHDDGDYTRLRVRLPADAMAAADAGTVYTAVALGTTTCQTTRDAVLKVAPADSFAISGVSPATISISTTNNDNNNNNNKTTLVVSAAAEGTFSPSALPQVFIVGPTSSSMLLRAEADGTDTAERVEDVFYVSDTQLRIGVPTEGLGEGAYDMYLAFEMENGTAAGAFAGAAFAASGAVGVPAISAATRTVRLGTYATIVAEGANFGASEHYTAALRCRGRESKPITTDNVTVESTARMRIGLSVPSTLGSKSCVLEVTDTAYGFAMAFPGISIVYDDRRVSAWETRELPAAVCAPTAVAYDFGLGAALDGTGCCAAGLCANRSFLYLIGGDEDKGCKGIAPSASVYSVPTDVYGAPTEGGGAWESAAHLPAGLMHAAAEVVGPYIYVVGGLAKDGSVASTVLRAHVLQPAEAPVLAGAQRVAEAAAGIAAAGAYYYAVAAVYAADDACNPGGESLPSNLYAARVATECSRVELAWDAVEDAAAYYVYRTPAPGLPPERLAFLAEVDAATLAFADTGANTPDEKRAPKQLGDIGNWATLPGALTSPRYGHATAVTRASKVQYMFAMGGFAAADGTRATNYETVKIVTAPPASAHGRTKHTLEDWTAGTLDEFPQRAFWRASVLDSENIGFENYISAIVLGGAEAAPREYVSTYVQNNPYFMAAKGKETAVSAFGYCQFVMDNMLYNVGGTNETETLSPLPGTASSHFMPLE